MCWCTKSVCVRAIVYLSGGGSEKNVLHEVGGSGKMKHGIPNFAPAPPPLNNDRSLIVERPCQARI